MTQQDPSSQATLCSSGWTGTLKIVVPQNCWKRERFDSIRPRRSSPSNLVPCEGRMQLELLAALTTHMQWLETSSTDTWPPFVSQRRPLAQGVVRPQGTCRRPEKCLACPSVLRNRGKPVVRVALTSRTRRSRLHNSRRPHSKHPRRKHSSPWLYCPAKQMRQQVRQPHAGCSCSKALDVVHTRGSTLSSPSRFQVSGEPSPDS